MLRVLWWWWLILCWPLLTSRRRKKSRSDFLSGCGIRTSIGRRVADAEEIFRDVGTAQWHFVAVALTFEPFYPDLRFLGSPGSLGSGSRNRYYPPLSPSPADRNFALRSTSTFDRVYTNPEITQLISTLSGKRIPTVLGQGVKGPSSLLRVR